ncbi:MAG: NCS2 family permease [Bacilli bacterium]|jgi:AGZA family xanthine/uracil permease-like MFS transporter|nr:NCS2 family permease [Bacilli bacterium]
MAEVQETLSVNPNEPQRTPKTAFGKWLDHYFGISKYGSTIIRELVGGLIIFLAMFYILPVNANMLTGWSSITSVTTSNVKVLADGTRQILLWGDVWAPVAAVYAGVFAATAVSAAVTTLIMGFFGKLPVGLASGMGINSMIAYTVMLGMGYNFAQCMALVFMDGLIFLIISVTPLRSWIVRSIPHSLKIAISAGIGFFIAFIGLQDMKIIVPSSSTAVALGDFKDPYVLLGLAGLILVLALSSLPKNNKATRWISRFSVIISLLVMGVVSASCGVAGVNSAYTLPTFYDSSYSISSLGAFGDVWGACFHGFDVLAKPEAYALIFALFFIDFFDTTGTLLGVEEGAGMVNKRGEITVNDQRAMITDAFGTLVGSVCGTTSVTSFVESTTGVAAGARTGLAAVVTGLLFALSLAIYPALGMFSASCVTGLALVYVGVCMFANLSKLEWKDWIAVGSGFITCLFMLVTYSISDGIAWGFISYTVMTLAAKRFHKSDIPVTAVGAAFLVLYIVEFATGIK